MVNLPAAQTSTALVQASSTVIVHRPGPDADPTVNPCVVIPATDAPMSAWYTWPSLIPNLNARPSGTYTVMTSGFNWDNPSDEHTVNVTVRQYEYPGSASAMACYPLPQRTFVPAVDAPNGLVAIGEVTLPVGEIPPDNVDAVFEVAWNSDHPLDRLQDILFIDTAGQLLYVDLPGAMAYDNWYFDEPSATDDIGRISGSVSLRNRTVNVLQWAQVSGGPITVDPGNGLLFVYGLPSGPGIAGSYFPRWWSERLS
jgi:hypothetical protein